MNTLEVAQLLVKNGVSIIPIKTDGSKAPAVSSWKQYQERQPTNTELDQWFRSANKLGIAITCGLISGGLEVLDFDDPSIFPKWMDLVKKSGGKDLLLRLILVQTPSGGYHAIYRCPTIEGNQKLAQRMNYEQKTEVLIETRGEGGYVLTVGSPPECHPALKTYEFINRDFTSIPIISVEERELLFNCARQFNEIVKPKRTITGTSTNGNNRPGDDFNSKATWDNILTPTGWAFVRQSGESSQWQKPDKNGPGISATTNHQNSDLLYVFSTNAPPFEPECAYSKFAAFALLNHGGNFSDAAKDLASKGYGNIQHLDWSNSETFGELIQFGEINTPEITSDFLPSVVKEFVDALAEETQTPVAMPAMLSLPVLGASIQKRFEIAPFGDSYTEPLSIWTVVALPPATRKSAVQDRLMKPVIEWEKEETIRLAPEIDYQNTQRDVLQKRIDELTRQASKYENDNTSKNKDEQSKSRSEVMAEIAQLKQELPDVIRAPRIFITDSTPEGLQVALAENSERSAIITDEGNLFEIMAGLYSEGKSNLDVYLQGHAGGTIRVKRSSREVYLNKIAVTLGLAIQPQILCDLRNGSKQAFRGKGLLARFLFCLPESNVGKRNIRERKSIPAEINEAYHSGIKRLLNIKPIINEQGEQARQLSLDPEACELFQEFSQYIENKQGIGGEFEHIQDFTGKLPGQLLRIAGLCHVAEELFKSSALSSLSTLSPIDNLNHSVSKKTLEPIIELGKKLIIHFQAALDLMHGDEVLGDAKQALRWIVANAQMNDNGAYFFKQSDLHHSKFNKSKFDRVNKALTVLQERHMISYQCKLDTKKPTYVYYVNPDLISYQLKACA